eukprot:m.25951 g.25951  ORF g.25951 m.25951 type:complete len:1105 (+) comp8780_c0_seq2:172-3486(+)
MDDAMPSEQQSPSNATDSGMLPVATEPVPESQPQDKATVSNGAGGSLSTVNGLDLVAAAASTKSDAPELEQSTSEPTSNMETTSEKPTDVAPEESAPMSPTSSAGVNSVADPSTSEVGSMDVSQDAKEVVADQPTPESAVEQPSVAEPLSKQTTPAPSEPREPDSNAQQQQDVVTDTVPDATPESDSVVPPNAEQEEQTQGVTNNAQEATVSTVADGQEEQTQAAPVETTEKEAQRNATATPSELASASVAVEPPTSEAATPTTAAALVSATPVPIKPEIKSPAPPATPSASSDAGGFPRPKMTNQLQFLDKTVKRLMAHKWAWPFNKPVDPIKQNLPTYLDVIKHPMDFGTIKRRLKDKVYTCGAECIADITLVFDNCRTYNVSTEDVVVMANAIEDDFKECLKQLPEPEVEITRPLGKRRSSALLVPTPTPAPDNTASRPRRHSTRVVRPPSRDMIEPSGRPSKELRECRSILNELLHRRHTQYSFPFLEPVDVKGLNLVDYHEIIKHPMDLGTIKKKLDAQQYDNKEGFAADVRLMFENCYTYNAPQDAVTIMARKLHQVFEHQYAKIEHMVDDPSPPKKRAPSKKTSASASPARSALVSTPAGGKARSTKTQQPARRARTSSTKRATPPSKKSKAAKHADDDSASEWDSDQASESSDADSDSDADMDLQKMHQQLLMSYAAQLAQVTQMMNKDRSKKKSKKKTGKSSKKTAAAAAAAVAAAAAAAATTTPPTSKPKKPKTPAASKPKARPKPKPKAKPTKGKPKPKAKPPTPPPSDHDSDDSNASSDEEISFSYDQKRQLSIDINQLPMDKLPRVLDIIRANEPHLQQSNDQEVEIDFDKLRPRTLSELDNFVRHCFKGEVPGSHTQVEKTVQSATHDNEDLDIVQPTPSGVVVSTDDIDVSGWATADADDVAQQSTSGELEADLEKFQRAREADQQRERVLQVAQQEIEKKKQEEARQLELKRKQEQEERLRLEQARLEEEAKQKAADEERLRIERDRELVEREKMRAQEKSRLEQEVCLSLQHKIQRSPRMQSSEVTCQQLVLHSCLFPLVFDLKWLFEFAFVAPKTSWYFRSTRLVVFVPLLVFVCLAFFCALMFFP